MITLPVTSPTIILELLFKTIRAPVPSSEYSGPTIEKPDFVMLILVEDVYVRFDKCTLCKVFIALCKSGNQSADPSAYCFAIVTDDPASKICLFLAIIGPLMVIVPPITPSIYTGTFCADSKPDTLNVPCGMYRGNPEAFAALKAEVSSVDPSPTAPYVLTFAQLTADFSAASIFFCSLLSASFRAVVSASIAV